MIRLPLPRARGFSICSIRNVANTCRGCSSKYAAISAVKRCPKSALFLSPTPLIRVFLYNDSIFDIPKIERRVAELNAGPEYNKLLLGATKLFAASFFLSSLMNLALAQWFFRGFDATAIDALENYNAIVARLTGWGFAVIGVPILVFLFFTLRRLLKGLGALTGFSDEQLMLPR